MDIDFRSLNIKDLNAHTKFEKSVSNFISDWFSTKKTFKVQTSGSTGKPKILDVEKGKMLDSAQMTCDFLGLMEGDSALLCLPIEYISGKMMVVRSIYRKMRLTVAEPSSFPLKNIEKGFDFCAMTPLQVENSLAKIHLIGKIIIGGAAVSESLKKKINQKLFEIPTTDHLPPTTIFETFGMSETLSHIAMRQIFPKNEDFFKTLDGVEISVDNRGCLRILAPKLNSDILQTNDLVEIKNGKEFRFLGRIDNIINSGGAKIFPEELESIVKREIPYEAVFIGMPDEVLGEKLVLIIEGRENQALTQKLSSIKYKKSFHKPKEVLFLEKIPRLPNGKIDRISLKKIAR